MSSHSEFLRYECDSNDMMAMLKTNKQKNTETRALIQACFAVWTMFYV